MSFLKKSSFVLISRNNFFCGETDKVGVFRSPKLLRQDKSAFSKLLAFSRLLQPSYLL